MIWVKQDGLRIDPERVNIIDHIKPAKDRKELQRQYGFFNFWRRLIPQFSQKTYNLRQLLRSDQPYLWTRACDEELNFLKGSLRSDMVLAPIRYDRPFYCFTDGSSYGTGFCLAQKWPSSVDPKREVMRPISFGGHANVTKSQQNASGGQVELLAVCQGLGPTPI
jgi:hypothetical protein